jgi:hypothetical protein
MQVIKTIILEIIFYLQWGLVGASWVSLNVTAREKGVERGNSGIYKFNMCY